MLVTVTDSKDVYLDLIFPLILEMACLMAGSLMDKLSLSIYSVLKWFTHIYIILKDKYGFGGPLTFTYMSSQSLELSSSCYYGMGDIH